MNWNKNLNEGSAEDIESWAYPPSGGRMKMILLGIVVPMPICYYAVHAWIIQEATWLGRGEDMIVKGGAAQALALYYFAIAAFFHFRYFWGLWPAYRVFEIGIVLSMMVGLGGCGTACYYVAQ